MDLNCGDVRSRTSYNLCSVNCIKSPLNCGEVRSRTSYNLRELGIAGFCAIVVTSDLGRVTTPTVGVVTVAVVIVVTSDLGRVTTQVSSHSEA